MFYDLLTFLNVKWSRSQLRTSATFFLWTISSAWKKLNCCGLRRKIKHKNITLNVDVSHIIIKSEKCWVSQLF